MDTSSAIVILDGGLGTLLEDKYNIKFSSTETPLWSSHLLVTDQPTLAACHRDFAVAGADIIYTATYQTSIAGFANTRTPNWPNGVPASRIGGFVEDAVRLASEAAQVPGCGKKVALALGPYGATMVPSQEYSGQYDEDHSSPEALKAWHLERISLFANVPVVWENGTYVAFETIPRYDEIMAIRKTMEESKRQGLIDELTQFSISCVFPGDDMVLALPDGTPVEDAVHAMLSKDVSGAVPWMIGINCTKVSKLPALVERFEQVVRRMLSSGKIEELPALVLYPDGTNGEVYNTTTQEWELPEGREAPKVCNVTSPIYNGDA
jgi:homocysteine S-methyltransferase